MKFKRFNVEYISGVFIVNTRKLLQKKVNPKVQKQVLASFDYISSFFKEFSIELLSIDYVLLRSLDEINELGQLYLCKTESPFFCMIGLSPKSNIFYKIGNEVNIKNPISVLMVTLTLIDGFENDNLLVLILPINGKKKSQLKLFKQFVCQI